MTGPGHYREAERLLATQPFCHHDRVDCEHGQVIVAKAQVHAMLALAAATAMDTADGYQAWLEVAGVQP